MPIYRTRTIGSNKPLHKKGDIYIIQINDIVSARLYKEEGKLRGEAPFLKEYGL